MAIESGYLDDLADADLVLRFKAGNDHALDVLLRRHSEDLYRLCCRLTANKEDAEDIYQESLVRAIDNVTTLQSGSAFRGWLFRIARNLSVDSFRFRRRVCQLPDEEHTPLPLHVDGPHAGVEIGEEHVTVSEALQRLAQSHRDVLVLREVEGLSYADIADRLNLSKSAVETLLFRARRRLREEYAKRTSGVALLAGLQEFVPRLTGETTVTKVAVTAAVLGGAIISTPRVFPHRVTGNTSATAPVRAHQRQVNRLALRTAPTILHGGTGLSDGARAAIRSASRQAAPRTFRHTFVPRRVPAIPSKTMHRRDRPARRPSLGLVTKHLVHAMARQGRPHRQAGIVAVPSSRLVSAGKPAVNRSLRAGAFPARAHVSEAPSPRVIRPVPSTALDARAVSSPVAAWTIAAAVREQSTKTPRTLVDAVGDRHSVSAHRAAHFLPPQASHLVAGVSRFSHAQRVIKALPHQGGIKGKHQGALAPQQKTGPHTASLVPATEVPGTSTAGQGHVAARKQAAVQPMPGPDATISSRPAARTTSPGHAVATTAGRDTMSPAQSPPGTQAAHRHH